MRIIQFLNWKIDSIIPYLSQVQQQGFDTIQISPVQPFKKVEGQEWWAVYQPLDFKIGNDYGNKEDLKRLCAEAKKYNIKVTVDVITNHLANNGDNQPLVPNKKINPEIRDNPDYWKKQHKVGDFICYEDVIEESIGLPGLNLKNPDLQKRILNFLAELKDCGVSGFRFDAAKHIGLPSDGVNYFQVIHNFLEQNQLFAYGEFLDGPSELDDYYQKLLNEKKNELTDYMYILTQEDSKVKDSSKKITYVESHDTYLNGYGSTRYDSTDEVIDRYTKLTEQYENTLFYVRDKKRGQRLNTSNPDRSIYADLSGLTDIRVKQANHNLTKKSIDIQSEKKESREMNDKNPMTKLHAELSENFHNILINQVTESSTIEDDLLIAFYDYKVQLILKDLLNANEYDDFSLRCTLSDIFNKKKSWKVSGRTFETFLEEAKESINNARINQNNICGHDNNNPNIESKHPKIKDKDDIARKDKLMVMYKQLCVSLHNTIADNITYNTPPNEALSLVLLDYKITQILNDILGVVPHDDPLTNNIVDDLYESNKEKYQDRGISKTDFYIRFLNILKARSINHNITDGIDVKKRQLVK